MILLFNKFEKTRNKIKTSDISQSNDIENDIHSMTPVTPIHVSNPEINHNCSNKSS